MNAVKQRYLRSHPNYQELEIPEYTLHKIKLIAPSTKFAEESLNWVSDKQVGQYMGSDFSQVSLEGEGKRLTDIIKDTDAYHWFIECDGKVIGNININEIKKLSKEFSSKSGKLNYLIGNRDLWGKGIVTAVAKKVLEWVFRDGSFELIKSRALTQNKGSQAVLKKLGFIEYGKEEYNGPSIGEPTHYISYKLPKEEFN